ncbi:MAG: hypothetical protein AAFR47_02135 [Pseudomonadota bacterium]
MYVSITGLRTKGPWAAPLFWWHAVASMRQAQTADGCLAADARTIDGVHHTRSLWRSEADMRAFLQTGAHLKAVRRFRQIAAGKTFGFAADALPDWDEVHRLWQERGRPY